MLSRGFAAWLIALAALPWTAPFATCDFGNAAHRAGTDVRSAVHDDTVLKFKVRPESLVAGVSVRNILPPFLIDTFARSGRPASGARGRRALHTILRV
jgi:hypothetical protein